MSGTPPLHLATIRRGEVDEAVVRGHVAVVDASGRLVACAGDPDAITTLRSCVKPLQALPFVRDAAGRLGVSEGEIAVACSSHNGEPVHVAAVLRLLSRVKLGESALSCGPQPPMNDESARAIAARGELPGRIHNNCSGKHAAMLAACVVRGWPVDGYAAPGHPLQREVRAVMSSLGDIDLDRAPSGIDGCGLPTQGVPLRVLAAMFAAALPDPGFVRCQDAMATHPYLVAGRGRFDTALLTAAGTALTPKAGAAALWVAVRRPAGPAIAIKLEAGDGTALPAVAMAALGGLGWLAASAMDAPGLAAHRRTAVHNWDGAEVGAVTVCPGWSEGLAA